MNELFENSYLSIMSAENDKLRKELQQKENIIKEAREYIDHCIFDYDENSMVGKDFVIVKNILDKGNNV